MHNKWLLVNGYLLVGLGIDSVGNDRKMFVISANNMCATEFIVTYDFIARYSCLINLSVSERLLS